MTDADKLCASIEAGDAVIAIIGLGYVGLPLAHVLHAGGLRVLGFDIDPAKIDLLAAGRSYLSHFDDQAVSELAESSRFAATVDFDQLVEADVIVVCVPTPLGTHNEPDLSYVLDSARAIGKRLRPGQLVVLESTTYPRTTQYEFLPAMLESAEAAGREKLVPGENFFVAFSPEREDPGNKAHSTRSTPKLVGGIDQNSTRTAAAFYRRGVDNVVEVSSAEVAEAAKLLENIFRSVNIAMVNELKQLFTEMDVDIWEVVRAASTKPFGFMPFYPGPGLGGHCIPIDPYYLTWKAKEFNLTTRFIELAGEINTQMPDWVVDRVAHALNEEGKSVRNTRVLVMGLAYKPDVGDTRESPSFELIAKLDALGAKVDYCDPYVPHTVPVRKYDLDMSSIEITRENLEKYDVVLIATNHSGFDYELIAESARLIVDTRDAMRPFQDRICGKLVRA